MTTTDAAILAVETSRKTNAELIEACVTLGYLKPETDAVLDATYGLGRFWTIIEPAALYRNDLDPQRGLYHFDYTDLPEPWKRHGGAFDVVVFDPPYKLNGTGGSHASDEAYGVATPWATGDGLMKSNMIGFEQCVECLKPGGFLLFKIQDQVVSGHKRWLTHEFANAAQKLGLDLVDQLHLLGYRVQPPGRRQVHSRSNYSTLQVYRK